jgi:hypothetical protein
MKSLILCREGEAKALLDYRGGKIKAHLGGGSSIKTLSIFALS